MRWIVLLSLMLSGQAWATGYQEVGPRRPITGTVNFDLYRGYLMVVHGSAGPVKGLTFLVDTGASPTVLDRHVAQRLHLATRAASIAVVGGSVAADQAIVPSLNLGPVQRQNLPVLIEDLSFLEKALPFPVDGVIGLDILGDGAFLIDYAAHRIQFGAYPLLANSVALHMKNGLALVDAEVNGVRASLLLDTGASSLTLFTRETTANLKVTAIGEFARKQLKVRSLRLGEMELGQESVAVAGGGAGYAFDGLMSPAALGIRRVAIDLGRGEMNFSR
jgi:predicted aspartyl protease